MILVDTHCHLTFPQFNRDREEIIENFESDNLKFVIEVGVNIDNSFEVVELAKNNEKIFASVGIHPHDAKDFKEKDLDTLKILAQSCKKVKAIGEIGLDFYRNLSPKDIQYKVLEKQIILANELDLPVIFHVRTAYKEMYNFLKEVVYPNKLGVVHCFSSDWNDAKKFLDMGFHIGIDGPVTFKNNTKLEEVVKNTPLNRLLAETDSPYLTPHPFRGKRNQPKYVKYVIEKIAQIKKEKPIKIGEILFENAKAVFNI